MSSSSNSPSPDKPIRLMDVPGCICVPDPLQLLPRDTMDRLIFNLQQAKENEVYAQKIALYEQLLQCHILMPIPKAMQGHDVLSLFSLEDPQGHRGLPLFTSEASMQGWLRQEAYFIATTLDQVAGLALTSSMDCLLVNIADAWGVEIPIGDCVFLAEGLIPPPSQKQDGLIKIPEENKIQLALPEVPLADSIRNCLLHFCEHHQRLIDTMYLLEMAINDGPKRLTVAIRMPKQELGSWEKHLWPDLQAVLKEMLEIERLFNVVLLNQAESLLPHIESLASPFYESSHGRIE